MGEFLFLKGDSGEGKTTLLFQCLRPWKEEILGFYTQRLLGDTGETMGFRLMPAKGNWQTRAAYQEGLSEVFIEHTPKGWVKRPEVFQKRGMELLLPQGNPKLWLMDEIGGIELAVPEFMEAVQKRLKGPVPCIGVLKSRKNFQSMTSRIKVSSKTDERLEALERLLSGSCDGRLLSFEREEKEKAEKEILTFLKRNLGEPERRKTL